MNTINRHTLSNGLRIVHIHDTSSEMVFFDLLYGVGARNESPDCTGIAHLLEHLMFEGTPAIPSYDQPLQQAGGENNASTGNDFTHYYLSLPKRNAELAFWLESDRMANLQLSEESIKVQKNVVMEEFKQHYLNRPYGDVDTLLRSLSFKKHPYRWPTIGKKLSHIANVSAATLQQFYEIHYVPNNAILSIVGDIPFSQVLEWANKWFGDIEPKEPLRHNLPVEPPQRRQRRREVTRSVPGDGLYMTFHMAARGETGYYQGDVLSDILSNGYSGRLSEKLVKKSKIFDRIDAFISGSADAGLFWIYGRVSSGVTIEKAEEALWHELERLQKILVQPKEIEKVRNRFESEQIFNKLSGQGVALNLALFEWHGNALEYNNEVERYRAITPIQLRETAITLFDKKNSSVLYYKKK